MSWSAGVTRMIVTTVRCTFVISQWNWNNILGNRKKLQGTKSSWSIMLERPLADPPPFRLFLQIFLPQTLQIITVVLGVNYLTLQKEFTMHNALRMSKKTSCNFFVALLCWCTFFIVTFVTWRSTILSNEFKFCQSQYEIEILTNLGLLSARHQILKWLMVSNHLELLFCFFTLAKVLNWTLLGGGGCIATDWSRIFSKINGVSLFIVCALI